MTLLQINASVRLIPPTSWENHWSAAHIRNQKTYKIPKEAAAMLSMAVDPMEEKDLILKISSLSKLSIEKLQLLLNKIRAIDLIVGYDENRSSCEVKILEKWSKYNWDEACEYHLSTLDYPFLNYSQDGFSEDRTRMKGYYNTEFDGNRYKNYTNNPQVGLDQLHYDMIPVDIESVYLRKDVLKHSSLDRDERILSALAMTFGEVEKIQLRSDRALPMIRKTSPSGGARHPTEAYLINVSMDNIAKGWYHYSVENNSLEWLKPADLERLRKIFMAHFDRTDFNIRALIVLTYVFERNMYRYREPRTYRVVHIDAGHLCGTLEMSAQALGIDTYFHSGIDDAAIEDDLKLDPLEESVITAVALG